MGGAGDYNTRFKWLKRVPGAPDGFGQKTDGFPVESYLWGAIQDRSGSRVAMKESERQVTTATIRLRNYPAVAAGDRLRDMEWGDLWTIEHAVRGDNEIVCEVTRPRFTTGGGTTT